MPTAHGAKQDRYPPRAFVRVLRGKQGWAKTRRNGEWVMVGGVAKEN